VNDDVYSFALRNALTEIHNICPDVKNSFIFTENGDIVAKDENTPDEVVIQTINSLNDLFKKAESIGGVEGVDLEGSKGRVNISYMNELYLVMVTSNKADVNYMNNVTQVLIPTILKVLEKIHPSPLKWG
jgi:predicted regulator of Ras-like GTPase activity (Roadblock/LC7/MglB family)